MNLLGHSVFLWLLLLFSPFVTDSCSTRVPSIMGSLVLLEVLVKLDEATMGSPMEDDVGDATVSGTSVGMSVNVMSLVGPDMVICKTELVGIGRDKTWFETWLQRGLYDDRSGFKIIIIIVLQYALLQEI